MPPSRLRPALVLAAWTLAVWTTRIGNIWSDDSLSVAGQLGRTALALAFTVAAVGIVVTWSRARRQGAVDRRARAFVRGVAALTVGVWAVRSVQIVTGGHSFGFVVVHLVLAVVSVALAVWTVRTIGSTGRRPRRDPQPVGLP